LDQILKKVSIPESGASTYKITLEDPNRNYGIQNIPNSVEVPLFIETELIINPFIGANSSPQLLLPPIDQGCVDQPFLHNPGAYDPDGDSLSFRLTKCRGAEGDFIPGFQLPNQVGSNVGGSFTMDPTTGEILWKNPKMQGEYNIAFLIEEWRNGLKIGYMTRDMQITIVTCDNNPPVIDPVNDTCVEAGDTLQFSVVATDADSNYITLTLPTRLVITLESSGGRPLVCMFGKTPTRFILKLLMTIYQLIFSI